MSSDDRFSLLLTALIAAGVILGASQMGGTRAPGVPDPPRIGGPALEAVGPLPEDPDRPEEAARNGVERRVLEVLGSREWPEFARQVIFHPSSDDALPESTLEQGSPYHLVVAADGMVRWTQRGESGAPGVPSGIPLPVATRSLHVALLSSERATPEQTAAATALWRAATRRLGGRAALFSDEVPGSTVRVPAGFDRAPYVAPQETRPGESKPASLATRKTEASDRVRIVFGTATIDAGVAATWAARRDGLMGRTSLKRDEGLLFVYRTADTRSFWMKNCCIALDILYLEDDGKVIALKTMEPPDPKLPEAELPRFPSPSPCRLVLEVEGGYARAHGVKVGSRLGLPASVQELFAKAEP
jgi:uncharacterized membrane protein (UPF0127 family)